MADESHYPTTGADSGSAKRKYEDAGPPPSSARRPTGFSGPDSAPSYNSVPPPMDEIQLAKQKAQEIAARIFNNAEAKRSKFDNDGSGWEANDTRDFSSVGPTDLGHAASSIPSSYGYGNTSKKIEIPNGKVGVIIGKAGETIKYLQMQSGAKIQITRDMDADPHSLTRDVDISGTPDAIAKAEQLIKDVLAEADAGGSGTVSRRVSGQPGGAEQFVMKIPNKKVGLVIGKGGETIKTMQASTGARIQVIPLHLPPGDTSTERTVQIEGTSDQIEAAKQMVNEVISENRVRNPMGGGYSQPGYQTQAPASWAPPGQQMPQQGYGYYNQPGAYPGQPAYPQQPYGGGYATGWDQSSGQQTAQGGGGGYDYYGQQQQQSQQTQPPGGPDTSAYGYGQQGQGYGQDGYYQQHGYGNPTSGYNVTGQTSDGQTTGYGVQADNTSQAPPTSAPQSGYGQQSGSGPNPSYPPQGSGQTGYGNQPSGYGNYGPPPTQKPPGSQPTNGQSPNATGYGQPPYGAPPAYGSAGYAQPPYGAPPPANQTGYGAQPPAYGGGYQQPPPAYSSDAASQAAPPVPKASPQQN